MRRVFIHAAILHVPSFSLGPDESEASSSQVSLSAGPAVVPP